MEDRTREACEIANFSVRLFNLVVKLEMKRFIRIRDIWLLYLFSDLLRFKYVFFSLLFFFFLISSFSPFFSALEPFG